MKLTFTLLTLCFALHGEFPSTGRTWDDGSPMSYSAAFGSNGERDYMRAIARRALGMEESNG